ncbi:sulfatase-like hydrolase/transferase, partial [Lutimonas sp.]|uniref:sulfatase-like hydrolase/transferase n=1 Tax=Lutimonas sp. TaxID=1872403 RepID=UPI003D9ACD7B
MILSIKKLVTYKLRIVLLLCISIVLSVSCQKELKKDVNPTSFATKANVLLILTDDQAYGDLSLMGNPISETPNLDLLANTGAFFENFYVNPVCAPTRASLLTGRYHQRTGVTGVTRGRENMSLDEETLANILKAHGYATGIFGKWHNGAHYPYHPMGRGFDEFVGFTSGHWSSYFDTT